MIQKETTPVAPVHAIVIPSASPLTLPKPYYESGGITIYHSDCKNILPFIDSVKAIIADPPYNVGYNYGGGVDDRMSVADYEVWCRTWFLMAKQKGGTVAVSPGIANLGVWHRIEEPRWIMCWRKGDSRGRCPVGWTKWEPVLLWGAMPKNIADTFDAPIQPLDPQVVGHPCPKPLRWGAALVDKLSDLGETVCDPFMGSGTVLVAAKYAGRKAIGIEQNEEYCEMASKRLSQGVLF